MTPADGCFGCWDRDGLTHRHDSYFIDDRTRRQFCHECTAALVAWELDGRPGGPEFNYLFWLGAAGRQEAEATDG